MSVFDPLNDNAFAQDDDRLPPWPTTPHLPGSPIPHLGRSSPIPPTNKLSSPQSPNSMDGSAGFGHWTNGPAPGLYGREPQIYGQPDPGLVSPTIGTAAAAEAEAEGQGQGQGAQANGMGKKAVGEKLEPYLKVRITGLDRNRRDILIKFDAQTNLSNFTGKTYRNVSRSYLEFQQFYEAVMNNNPHTIIPALPLAQTSAPTDEEDDRLVKIMLQRWTTRVCEDPILQQDEDVRSFVESDFGYTPTPRPKKKGSSGFSLIRSRVPDEDEELQRARFELTKLEGQFFETAKSVDRVAMARKALATVHIEMGNKLVNVATTEAHPPLGNALRKLGRTWHSVADLDQAQAISECVIVGDSFGYQGMNSRSAKETLQMRNGVLEEYQAAVKTTTSKRRHIERLKASSNIRRERVDEALEDIEEANKYEQVLARRAEGISQNLHRAMRVHQRHVNDDITTALVEHARSTIMYERQLLRELEALRSSVSTAANKALPPPAPPRPQIIPPLEDFHDQPRTAPPGPPPNGIPHRAGPHLHPHHQAGQQGFGRGPQGPFTATSHQSFASQQSAPTAARSTTPGPPLPQSAGAGPSSSSGLSSPLPVDPLGGRFADGTKSMFIKPPPTAATAAAAGESAPPLPISASVGSIPVPPGLQEQQPQRHVTNIQAADPLQRPSSASPAVGGGVGGEFDPLTGRPLVGQGNPLQTAGAGAGGYDPLGQARFGGMSASVRVQPTRPRLDPKEAASKLANMF